MSRGEKQNQNQLVEWVLHSIGRVFSCFSCCPDCRCCCCLSCMGCIGCCHSCCCLLVWSLCWLLTIASWRGQMLQLFNFYVLSISNCNCAAYIILIDLNCSFPIRLQYFNRCLSASICLHGPPRVSHSRYFTTPLFSSFHLPMIWIPPPFKTQGILASLLVS